MKPLPRFSIGLLIGRYPVSLWATRVTPITTHQQGYVLWLIGPPEHD